MHAASPDTKHDSDDDAAKDAGGEGQAHDTEGAHNTDDVVEHQDGGHQNDDSPHQGDEHDETDASAPDGAEDHGEHSATVDEVTASNFCLPEADVTPLHSGHSFVKVQTEHLTNDFANLQACGVDRSLNEADGFFAIDMQKGERWHIRVKEHTGRDVALYLLPECDTRVCEGAVDHCGESGAEHFNFIAPSTGRRFLAIDGIDDPSAGLEIIAMNPVCGDGDKMHSEGCDDGNTISGDGCDALCRIELNAKASEVEPNDDVLSANVLPEGYESVTLNGTLGGACDTDIFLFNLQVAQHVEFALTDPFGFACKDAPDISIEMRDENDRVVAHQDSSDGQCPILHVEDQLLDVLAGGLFTVHVSSPHDSTLFDYALAIVRHGEGEGHAHTSPSLDGDASAPHMDDDDDDAGHDAEHDEHDEHAE